jgi:hypothetical protein
MKLQLSDRFCASAKSKAVQTDYFDASVSGLALRVTSKGTKAWTLLFGTPRRRITLGRYPQISLAQARTMALVRFKCWKHWGISRDLHQAY